MAGEDTPTDPITASTTNLKRMMHAACRKAPSREVARDTAFVFGIGAAFRTLTFGEAALQEEMEEAAAAAEAAADPPLA